MHTAGTYRGTWRSGLAFLVCAVSLAQAAGAQNVVRRIKAVNPAQTDSVVIVSTELPRGITPSNIVDLGGMDLKYDTRKGAYYVRAEETLPALGSKEYSVVIEDVWVIPQEKIDELRQHAAKLTESLVATDRGDTAARLKAQIDKVLDLLEQRQGRYRINPGVTADTHIQSFEKTRSLWRQQIEDIGVMENLARGEGIELTKLLGPVPAVREKAEDAAAVGDKPGLFKFRVHNPGRSEQQRPVKQYLPREVMPEDVVSGDELQVRFDTEQGVCFLYKDSVTLKPGESVVFEVLVTNRWVILPSRYEALQIRITNVQAVAETWNNDRIKSDALEVFQRLGQARETEWPKSLNEEYIAFFHRQADVMEKIEEDIARLEQLLKQSEQVEIFEAKVLQDFKPPSRSTTWLIIWIVLGFLAFFSVLFFLRWYGKTKDEKM